MNKKILLTLIIAIVSVGATAQNVNIPDAKFKAYLLSRGVDTNKDGEIQVKEAAAYKSGIYYKNNASKGVDLTGLEAFISIKYLEVNANGLTKLDVTNNTELVKLYCFGNKITNLDLSKNTKLAKIDCYSNRITDLKLGSLPVLTSLRCHFNRITSIDVSGATKLTELFCHANKLTVLKTKGATALTKIYSHTNKDLTSLDLSTNSSLTFLWTYGCNLKYLNLANGNNKNFPSWAYRTDENTNLKCIQVDDVAYSKKTWLQKDPNSSYSLKCSSVGINELNNIAVSIYPNPTTTILNITADTKVTKIEIYNYNGAKVMEENITSFSVAHLSAGLYIINIHTDKGVLRKRFVKE